MLIRIISFVVKFGGIWYFNLFGSTITYSGLQESVNNEVTAMMMVDVHSRLRYYSGDFMNATRKENLRRDNVQPSRQRVIAGRYLP